jgi:hypothetical protein
MENNCKFHYLFFLFLLFTVISCESQKPKFSSPAGYDFNKPKQFRMPDMLREISGIAFHNGNSDTVYAEEDESGRVYHFKPGDKKWPYTRFGKNGDFEDISIWNNYVIMLRSDGYLFTFPFSETIKGNAQQVKEFKGLLPDGEYEGLATDDASGKIFVLCKHCDYDKTSKWGGGSILQMDSSGNLGALGKFEIDIKEIDALENTGKINFHPSALAINPKTRDWFILSSVNKLLVVTDQNWKVKSVYPLDPSLFAQPEGIAFDKQLNLYISNERGETISANILLFPFHKQ